MGRFFFLTSDNGGSLNAESHRDGGTRFSGTGLFVVLRAKLKHPAVCYLTAKKPSMNGRNKGTAW